MDNDAKMLKKLSDALIDLQVKYRASSFQDQKILLPTLKALFGEVAKYQIKLLDDGTIVNEADLAEMDEIKQNIDDAAERQQLLAAIGRTLGFVINRIA